MDRRNVSNAKREPLLPSISVALSFCFSSLSNIGYCQDDLKTTSLSREILGTSKHSKSVLRLFQAAEAESSCGPKLGRR